MQFAVVIEMQIDSIEMHICESYFIADMKSMCSWSWGMHNVFINAQYK